MKFSEIKQVPFASYQICVDWSDLKHVLDRYSEHYNCELCPDFQRGHVWNELQKVRYVEWILQGGFSGKDIFWNCKGWMNQFEGPMLLVDGLQRITAVTEFLDNKVTAFDHYFKDFSGRIPSNYGFIFHVNKLNTRAEVLQWYLMLNSGGTIHTEEELKRVRELLGNCKE